MVCVSVSKFFFLKKSLILENKLIIRISKVLTTYAKNCQSLIWMFDTNVSEKDTTCIFLCDLSMPSHTKKSVQMKCETGHPIAIGIDILSMSWIGLDAHMQYVACFYNIYNQVKLLSECIWIEIFILVSIAFCHRRNDKKKHIVRITISIQNQYHILRHLCSK